MSAVPNHMSPTAGWSRGPLLITNVERTQGDAVPGRGPATLMPTPDLEAIA